MNHVHRPQFKEESKAHKTSSRSTTPSKVTIKDDRNYMVENCRKEEQIEDCEDEELDPRVQDELEKLNSCTDQINQLENELEEANSLFRCLLSDSTHQLQSLAKKIGVSVIEKARPYYGALDVSNKAQKECQAAATAFQRACGIHAAAKETIALAEERFLSNSSNWEFDNAWQEMLNHATIKVMAAEKQKTDSEAEHLKRAATFTAAEQEVQRLEKKLHKAIQKSQPYFEQKESFNKALESQKKIVQELQEKVSVAKSLYSKSLRNLEEISESIHAKRKLRQVWSEPTNSIREPGVGAELNFDLDICDCGSVRSTVSGQSTSDCYSFDDTGDSCDSLVRQFAATSFKTSTPHPVTRARSCPCQMSSLSSSGISCQSTSTTDPSEASLDSGQPCEDSSVEGIQSNSESRIEL